MAELPVLEDDFDLLAVLRDSSSEDLGPLVQYVLGSDGSGRWTSQLQKTQVFKRYSPDHIQYADELVAEIQKFGGNSIANMARSGRGVSYREIVDDVGRKFGVKMAASTPVAKVEEAIQLAVLTKAYEKMSDEERRELFESLGFPSPADIPKVLPVFLVQAFVANSGFMVYKTAAIVANAIAKLLIGRGLTFAGNQTLMKSISVFAGPVGWAVTAAWTIVDLAGPAYRVTIPCVLHVAFLRQSSSVVQCLNGHLGSRGSKFCSDCGSPMP